MKTKWYFGIPMILLLVALWAVEIDSMFVIVEHCSPLNETWNQYKCPQKPKFGDLGPSPEYTAYNDKIVENGSTQMMIAPLFFLTFLATAYFHLKDEDKAGRLEWIKDLLKHKEEESE